MSYYPSSPSSSDENQHPPDPRYTEWGERSRTKLKERLYEAVDKRSDAVQELVSRVVKEWILKSGLARVGYKHEEWCIDPIMMEEIHQEIVQQIAKWKGLRWWKFNANVDSWSEWFKKAKCWQDQNQHKPLGRFWCFVLDELSKYTLCASRSLFPMDASKQRAVQRCLYTTSVSSIFTGFVRFNRTRETPLLPVRTLTQSKELQRKLETVDSGVTLSVWKEQTEREHKRQKHKRGNTARILNEKCCEHAEKVYSRCYEHLKEMIGVNDVISTPNMGDSDAISSPNGYESTRGYSRTVSPCESQRFSPTQSHVIYRNDGSSERALAQLTVENYYLKGQIERMKTRLWDQMMARHYPVYNVSRAHIPPPMHVAAGICSNSPIRYGYRESCD
eukprot:231370_1